MKNKLRIGDRLELKEEDLVLSSGIILVLSFSSSNGDAATSHVSVSFLTGEGEFSSCF